MPSRKSLVRHCFANCTDFRPPTSNGSTQEWAVPIRYTRLLTEPLLRSSIASHPVLGQMAVLKFAQGTNYRLTEG